MVNSPDHEIIPTFPKMDIKIDQKFLDEHDRAERGASYSEEDQEDSKETFKSNPSGTTEEKKNDGDSSEFGVKFDYSKKSVDSGELSNFTAVPKLVNGMPSIGEISVIPTTQKEKGDSPNFGHLKNDFISTVTGDNLAEFLDNEEEYTAVDMG